jgi:hypothetical protein
VAAVELVVAIRRDEERGHRLDPAREELEDVECRLVRPVDVLEHEDRPGPRLQLVSQRRHDLVRHRAALDELLQLAVRLLGDTEQRPERPRREKRIAGAPEDPP